MTVVVRRGRKPRKRGCESLTDEQRARVVQLLREMRHPYGGIAALARAMGVSDSAVSAVSGGKVPPGMSIAVKLAALCGVTIDELLGNAALLPASMLICPHCRAPLVVVARGVSRAS